MRSILRPPSARLSSLPTLLLSISQNCTISSLIAAAADAGNGAVPGGGGADAAVGAVGAAGVILDSLSEAALVVKPSTRSG
jgi:hypothetical protein